VSLLVPWLVFPAVLTLLCAGCGAVVSRLSGLAAGPWTLLPLGYAAIVVVGSFAVWVPGTSELAGPAVVGLAAAGGLLWVTGRPRPARSSLWALAAAAVVFAVYGAPIVLSGSPTFAGYITLDDASTLFAMTDRALEAGRSVDGLQPSTYEATLASSLMVGYPLGTLLPLGIGADLTGQDVAWVYQPYLAFLAGLLALGLYGLAGSFLRDPRARAAAAALCAQPALLYAYGLWDGSKELAAAALIALVVPVALACARARGPWLAAAVAAAAILLCLSVGGAIWLLPAVALAAVFAIRGRVWKEPALGVAATAALSLPAIATASTFLERTHLDSWRDDSRLANLFEPLSPAQVAGIWPSGDFRLRPGEPAPTGVLVALVLALAAAGLVVWARNRAWEPVAFAACAAAGAVAYWAFGSPWIGAKALATASPAVLLAAVGGIAWIVSLGRRVEAAVAAAAVVGGVLWSNALAYHEVPLAPYGQLRELERIGARFEGQGPALMTEYQPYGVRHFLRGLDAEGASELRRRSVPLRDGATLAKGLYADLDAFRPDAILAYRTLVLRRSPVESRPPSIYRLRWQGDWYEVWQRPTTAGGIAEHIALGADGPSAVPACAELRRLAVNGRPLAVVPRGPVAVTEAPAPRTTDVPLAQRRRYSIWLGGSVFGRAEAAVDGRRVGSIEGHLNNDRQWSELGAALLGPGTYGVDLRLDRPVLEPGSGGGGVGLGVGSIAVAPAVPSRRVVRVPAAQATRWCGRSLDWIEVLD
jgi:hypothetical protein